MSNLECEEARTHSPRDALTLHVAKGHTRIACWACASCSPHGAAGRTLAAHHSDVEDVFGCIQLRNQVRLGTGLVAELPGSNERDLRPASRIGTSYGSCPEVDKRLRAVAKSRIQAPNFVLSDALQGVGVDAKIIGQRLRGGGWDSTGKRRVCLEPINQLQHHGVYQHR